MALPTDELIPKPGYNPDIPDKPFYDEVEATELHQDWIYETWNSGYDDDWISTREAAYKLGKSSDPASSFSDPTRCIKNGSGSAELVETNTKIKSGSYGDKQCIKYKDLMPRDYVSVTFQLGDPTADINNTQLTGYFTVGGRRVNKVYSKMSTSSQHCGISFHYNQITQIQQISQTGSSSPKTYAISPKEILVYAYYSNGAHKKYASITVDDVTYTHSVQADAVDTSRKSWHHGHGVVFMPLVNSTSPIVSVKVGLTFNVVETTELDPDYSQCYLVQYYSADGNLIDLSFRNSPFANWQFGGNLESYNATNGGYWQFYGKTLPEKIEARAFYGLTTLEYFPFNIYKLSTDGKSKTRQTQTITGIGAYAFANTGITRFVLPSAIKELGTGCCSGCSKLSSVTFLNETKITIIPENCFSQCKVLTDCKLPSNTTEIMSYAFDGCVQYKFNIPNKVTRIDQYAYRSCICESSSWIPTSCVAIDHGAFAKVKFTNSGPLYCMPMHVSYWGSGVYKASVFHNQTIQLGNISKIPSETFTADGFESLGDKSGTSVIPTGTFTITFPATLTEIEDYAFYGRQFTTIDLSKTNIITLGLGCFAYNITATEIKLPSTLTTIGDYCFSHNYSCTSVSIPQSVVNIGSSAFKYLQNWYIGNKWCWASSIGGAAFEVNDPSFIRGEVRKRAPDYVTGEFVDVPTHVGKEEHWWFPNISKLSDRILWGRTVVECHVGQNCTSIGKEVITPYQVPHRQWFFYSSTSTMDGSSGDRQLGRRSGAEFNLIQNAAANYKKDLAWAWYLTSNHTKTFDPYLNHLVIYVLDGTNYVLEIGRYSPNYYRLSYQYLPIIQDIYCKPQWENFVINSDKTVTVSGLVDADSHSEGSGYLSKYNGTWKLGDWYYSGSSYRRRAGYEWKLPADIVKMSNYMDPFTYQGYLYNLMEKV